MRTGKEERRAKRTARWYAVCTLQLLGLALIAACTSAPPPEISGPDLARRLGCLACHSVNVGDTSTFPWRSSAGINRAGLRGPPCEAGGMVLSYSNFGQSSSKRSSPVNCRSIIFAAFLP